MCEVKWFQDELVVIILSFAEAFVVSVIPFGILINNKTLSPWCKNGNVCFRNWDADCLTASFDYT